MGCVRRLGGRRDASGMPVSEKPRNEHGRHKDRREHADHEAQPRVPARRTHGRAGDVGLNDGPAFDARKVENHEAAHRQRDVARQEVEDVEESLAAKEGCVGQNPEGEAGKRAHDRQGDRRDDGGFRDTEDVMAATMRQR